MARPFGGLHALLATAAARRPSWPAVIDPGRGAVTYAELLLLADRVGNALVAHGVRSGDRVAVHLAKSIDTVAILFGILRAGAAYIPVDPHGPAGRNAYIMNDCTVALAFVERRLEEAARRELSALGAAPPLIVVDAPGTGRGLADALGRDERSRGAPATQPASVAPADLAYILYTSGSTGRPKGVMLTHENALGYVDWCIDVFAPTGDDRFSSHAPFHFDLSILDIFVPLATGGTLVLVGHEEGKDATRIAGIIEQERLTVWYSAPSILTLLASHGDIASRDFSSLRLVLFAGEVFPVKHLRALQRQLPAPRYFNLYGPTETNVCTFHEIPPDIPEERTEPYPIGRTCAQLASRVVEPDGREVARGEIGELLISGPNVMVGYWGLPEQTAKAFTVDPDGERWYHTGDLVVEEADGTFLFRGRRDRMVKKRGFRVELGEIEACLHQHPGVAEAAVVATANDDGVRVIAFLATRDGGRLSLIALKQFCADRIPLYMVPDAFTFLPALPRTSTDKTDYQRLKEMA